MITLWLSGCERSGPGVQLVRWRVNTAEALANTALSLMDADEARAGKVLKDAGKALIGGLLNQRPCCVAVTLRNPSSSVRSINPSAFRLVISGQTFVPAEYALSDALPLTGLSLQPGEERTGSLVFMPPTSLAAAADEGVGTTQLIFDRAAEKKHPAATRQPRRTPSPRLRATPR